MVLYKVITEQKITNKVLAVVEADSEEEAMDKVSSRDIISVETNLEMKIDKYIPLEATKY